MESSSPRSHWLDVPGARLYYEVQGAGPVLMLIGHPMGSSGSRRSRRCSRMTTPS